MENALVDTLINKLIDSKMAKPDDILGCTAEEIVEIQKSQEIDFLPDLYNEFLVKMGKGAGDFLQYLECFYPDLLDLKAEAKAEILEDIRTSFRLPDDAFVFIANQSYEFFYFHTGSRESDPAIYHYIEGDGSSRDVKPRKQWEHLSDYFMWKIETISK